MTTSHIVVSLVIHSPSAWFIATIAEPFIAIDGEETSARWEAPTRVRVSADTHQVDIVVRYRGMFAVLGSTTTQITVGTRTSYSLTVTISVALAAPLRLELVML